LRRARTSLRSSGGLWIVPSRPLLDGEPPGGAAGRSPRLSGGKGYANTRRALDGVSDKLGSGEIRSHDFRRSLNDVLHTRIVEHPLRIVEAQFQEVGQANDFAAGRQVDAAFPAPLVVGRGCAARYE
jgi:hypothetical protein